MTALALVGYAGACAGFLLGWLTCAVMTRRAR